MAEQLQNTKIEGDTRSVDSKSMQLLEFTSEATFKTGKGL
jgi:hypothetical protein